MRGVIGEANGELMKKLKRFVIRSHPRKAICPKAMATPMFPTVLQKEGFQEANLSRRLLILWDL
jgi:hypothetical protein